MVKYSKAASSMSWLQGPRSLPASARVKGLTHPAANAGEGQYVEKSRDGSKQASFFAKVGGGSFIFKGAADDWCLGPVLDDTNIVWARKKFQGDRLPACEDEPWLADARFPGKPAKISLTRASVKIVSATGMRPADLNGFADPLVRMSIAGKPYLDFDTAIKKGTTEPQWDEEHSIDGAELGDVLHFKVLDWNPDAELDDMGDAKTLLQPGGFKGALNIMLRGRKNGTLRVEVQVPQIFNVVRRTQFSSDNPKEIVQALTKVSNVDQMERALGAFRSIVVSDEIRSIFVAAGAAQALVAGLNHAPVETRGEVAHALSNLAKFSAGRRIVVSSGGLQALVALFCGGTAAHKEGAMDALLQLDAGERMHQELFDADAVPKFLEMLRDAETSPRGAALAARVLAESLSSKPIASLLFGQDFLGCLVDLLGAKRSDDEKKQALYALEKMANLDEHLQALLSTRAFPAIVQALENGSLEVKAQAASAISALVSSSEARKMAHALVSAGGLRPLLALLADNHEFGMEQAARALRKLAGSRKVGEALIYEGGLSELLQLLKSRSSATRRAFVAKVIRALMSSNQELVEENIRQASDMDLIAGAIEELQRNPQGREPMSTPRSLPKDTPRKNLESYRSRLPDLAPSSRPEKPSPALVTRMKKTFVGHDVAPPLPAVFQHQAGLMMTGFVGLDTRFRTMGKGRTFLQ